LYDGDGGPRGGDAGPRGGDVGPRGGEDGPRGAETERDRCLAGDVERFGNGLQHRKITPALKLNKQHEHITGHNAQYKLHDLMNHIIINT